MSSFVRVRAVDGPKHEFYAASGEVVYVVEPAKSIARAQVDGYLEGVEKGAARAEKRTQKE